MRGWWLVAVSSALISSCATSVRPPKPYVLQARSMEAVVCKSPKGSDRLSLTLRSEDDPQIDDDHFVLELFLDVESASSFRSDLSDLLLARVSNAGCDMEPSAFSIVGERSESLPDHLRVEGEVAGKCWVQKTWVSFDGTGPIRSTGPCPDAQQDANQVSSE